MRWLNLSEAQDRNWDIVIVGSGIGGSTAALAAVKADKKVLVITKTENVRWKSLVSDRSSGKETVPFLGDGLGGSSALYGMVMERLEPSDFLEMGGAWPESILSWQHSYLEAEKIFGVNPAFTQDALHPLFQHLRNQNLEVKSLPLACRQVPDCSYCQGVECRRECKISAVTGPLREASRLPNLYFLSAEVVELRSDRASRIDVDVRIGTTLGRVRCSHLVLAAGALRTPGLLRRCSKLPAIGRYLMRHLIDIYELRWPELASLSSEERQKLAGVKAWGTDSFYNLNGVKLGTVQSFGKLPDLTDVWKEMIDLHPWLGAVLLVRPVVKQWMQGVSVDPLIASIVEDEPSESNQVVESGDGRLEIHYELSKRDREKVKLMRELMTVSLGDFMRRRLSQAENNFRLAHACGTCRMGSNTDTSVCDDRGKVHFTENIWIADASVFPSSGGKNPALTIAAHALRMTERLLS